MRPDRVLALDALQGWAEYAAAHATKRVLLWRQPWAQDETLAWLKKNPQWAMYSVAWGHTDAPDVVRKVCAGVVNGARRRSAPEDVLRMFAAHLTPRKAKQGGWNTPALLAEALAWLKKNPQWAMHSVARGRADAPDVVRTVCAGLRNSIRYRSAPEDVLRMFAAHLTPRKAKKGAWNTPALLAEALAWLKKNPQRSTSSVARGRTDAPDAVRKVCAGLRSHISRRSAPEDVLRMFAAHLTPRQAKKGGWNTPALLAEALAWLKKNPQRSMNSVAAGRADAPDVVRTVCAGLRNSIRYRSAPEDVLRMFAAHLTPRKAKKGAWNTPALLAEALAWLKKNPQWAMPSVAWSHTDAPDVVRKVCAGVVNSVRRRSAPEDVLRMFAAHLPPKVPA